MPLKLDINMCAADDVNKYTWYTDQWLRAEVGVRFPALAYKARGDYNTVRYLQQ